MRGYDHTARRENTQDDGQVRIGGRRDGGHGHHERVRWLEQQNTRSSQRCPPPHSNRWEDMPYRQGATIDLHNLCHP